MFVTTCFRRSSRRGTERLRLVAMAVAILGSLPCLNRVTSAESGADNRPMLRVPLTDSIPVVDGKLDETCWKGAAKTGPLKVMRGEPAKSATEAFILRDADHLYVGVSCAGTDAAEGEVKPGELPKAVERVELLIDSSGDRNSYYMIRITNENGGRVSSSYNEHDPPWYDRTWQPQFESAVTKGVGVWSAEFALPFEIFNKNKTLASEIEFNVSRSGMSGGEIHSWHGTAANPDEWGILAGIPSRDRLPKPDYVKPGGDFARLYRAANRNRRSFLAEQEEQTIPLGPGSAHPCTTGEVVLELEGFLMEGEPYAMGFAWDLAVDERTGELYVLFDPRLARGLTEVRVFDRQGRYLRTIMPMNPTLPRASLRDLCQKTAREGDAELIVPKMFEVSNGEISMYGEWWTHPQKLAVAPNGDLIMSNIFRGTLWRMRPDGSLPLEGWTSVYHPDRNEPFDSTFWTQNSWKVRSVRNYLPFHSLHYPYFCFGPNGAFYMSAGQSSLHTRHYGFYWEVGEQPGSVFVRPPRPQHYGEISEEQESYHWSPSGTEGRGAYVWKCRLLPGVKVESPSSSGGFAEPSGLVLDGAHLIVADAGNNRLRVLDAAGREVASITHYEHQGEREPLNGPTALAIDPEKNLYVLVGSEPRPKDERFERSLGLLMENVPVEARKPPEPPRKLIKLKSWREPELLAASKPLAPDVLQIAVDAGVSPSLVWVANGAGPGSLVQLAGDDLSVKGEWRDSGRALSFPRQSGHLPALNIDPQTGDLYVEDDSNYRMYRYGTVYRVDQDGNVLEKWPPPPQFDDSGLQITSPWGRVNHERHFRYPQEPLFIDSIFGKDGRVYRWKLSEQGVEILRFDRAGKPLPFKATGSNALFVDRAMQAGLWHDVSHGMDVDRQGNVYFVAKVDIDPESPAVSAYVAQNRQVNVYDADGNLKKRGLLVLNGVRGIQVDDEGNLYVMHRPAKRPWEKYLALTKFPPSGGEPIWSRRWGGYIGQAEVDFAPCICTAMKMHQTLDGKGYLYAAGKYSVQVIRCETGELVGEFGSYGNMDCRGKGSKYPHPEIPFGTISALSVWKDRLFVVDVLNRRIAKCRIIYNEIHGHDSKTVSREGLMLHYTFDSEGRGVVEDRSGMGHRAKVNGAIWTDGAGEMRNGAYRFDGKDDWLDAGRPVELKMSDVVSISAWIRPATFAPRCQTVISDHAPVSDNGKVLRLHRDRIEFLLGPERANEEVGTRLETLDRWYHVVATYDGSTMRLFLDGVRADSKPRHGRIVVNDNPVLIGKCGFPGELFSGMIDDVMIYHRVLTEREIKQLYMAQGGK